jgi:adenylate cyclase
VQLLGPSGFKPRLVAIGVLLGVAGALAGLGLWATPLGQAMENTTYDRRLAAVARQSDARQDIALVLINESSLQALEPAFGSWPWPRMLHAGVIDFLSRAGARVIVYDILFLERDRRTSFEAGGRQISGADSDAAFVDAVKRAGNVVVLVEAVFEGLEGDATPAKDAPAPPTKIRYEPGGAFPERPAAKFPFADLAAAAFSAGHNYVRKSSGNIGRDMWPFVTMRGVAIPSLGLSAALAAAKVPPSAVRVDGNVLRLDAAAMPLGVEAEALINFHGPFRWPQGRETYPTYSFFDVLLSEDRISSGEKPPIDPAVFRDKLVFVGTSAPGLSDIWDTPFLRAGGMPGVQLHAAFADDVLSGRFMRRAALRDDVLLTVAAAAAAGVVATLIRVAWAVPIILASAGALILWLTLSIRAGVWYATLAPLVAIFVAAFEGVAWQYFVEGREKRRVSRLFGRFVSKDVFDHLMANPAVARLGGERREMTVLFSDIRGFTAASEKGAPEDIVQQLNEYFTEMVDVLFRHQGTLDKFVGDMVMGLFGAPVRDPRHADHAVAAAVEMVATLDRLNAGWEAAGRPTLDIGIGINSGEMIAGNIGSETIMSYTVIGDAVNLGARLESLNKDYASRILISEGTRRRLTLPMSTKLIGEVTVKGRKQPVVVYEVTERTS